MKLVKLDGSRTDANVLLENCWATPGLTGSDLRYDIITEGCAADRQDVTDGILEIVSNGINSTGAFSIDSFQFSDETNSELYFHCDVTICTDTCEPVCLTRRRRRDEATGDEICIEIGPINVIG